LQVAARDVSDQLLDWYDAYVAAVVVCGRFWTKANYETNPLPCVEDLDRRAIRQAARCIVAEIRELCLQPAAGMCFSSKAHEIVLSFPRALKRDESSNDRYVVARELEELQVSLCTKVASICK